MKLRKLSSWLCATIAAAVSIGVSHAQQAPKVLFIGSAGEPTAGADGDVWEKMVEWWGEENLTYLQASASSTEDADEVDVVVLSSTPGSGDMRNKFHELEVGVLNWEEALGRTLSQGEMGITTGNRQKYTITEVSIENNDHPITSGQELGLVEFFQDGAAENSWGSQFDPDDDSFLAPGAMILATIPDELNAAIVAVEKGDLLWDLADETVESPGRRVMFPMLDGSATELTDGGWDLLKRSIEWTGGVLVEADTSLLGHWPLTEGVGEDLNDATGNNDVAELIDGEWIAAADGDNVPEFLSGASVASFDGDATFALLSEDIIPAFNEEVAFSIAFFTNQVGGGTGVNEIVLGNRWNIDGVDDAPREFIKFTPTKFEVHQNGDGSQNVPYDEPIPDDVWTHHAIVKDGAEFTYFRNGEAVSSFENDDAYPINSQPLFIGGQVPGGGEHWSGAMADVGVWSRTLSAEEVATIATDGIASLSPGGPTGPIFAPGDGVFGGQISEDGTKFEVGVAGDTAGANNWPAGEAPASAIDGTVGKYLNFAEFNSGILVTPASGPSVANQMQLWTANDEEPRDPASYEIYGTKEELGAEGPFNISDFKLLDSGDLELPSARNVGGDLLDENSETVIFGNSTSYASYLIVFPTVKNEASANSMQIAGIQLSNIGGVDLLTVSRVKVSPEGMTFELINRPESVVDKASIKLVVDGVEVPTTLTDIEGGVMVTFTAVPAWDPNSVHPYTIFAQDMNGTNATRSGPGEAKVKDSLMPYNTPLVGPEGEDGLWGVRYVWDAGTIGSTAAALEILQSSDDPDFEGQVFDTQSATANLADAGRWSEWDEYPDEVLDEGGGAEDFIVSYKGTLKITEAGVYTFGVNTDDGMGLRIWGAEFTSKSGPGQIDPVQPNSLVFPGTTGNSNTHGVTTLAVGNYPIEFFWFERGGGDKGVLYFGKGEQTAFADLEEGEDGSLADSWALVGGTHLIGAGALPFQITNITRTGTEATLTWDSKEGESYIIRKSLTLQGEFQELTDGFESQGESTSFTDTTATERDAYYRVVAE